MVVVLGGSNGVKPLGISKGVLGRLCFWARGGFAFIYLGWVINKGPICFKLIKPKDHKCNIWIL